MDGNKLEKLKSINYKIKKTCGTCRHSKFSGKDFGECLKFTYQHKKHTESLRGLSINLYGWCENYEARDDRNARLHGFLELLES